MDNSASASGAAAAFFCKASYTAALFSAYIDTFLIPVGTGTLPHNYHLVLQLNVQTDRVSAAVLDAVTV